MEPHTYYLTFFLGYIAVPLMACWAITMVFPIGRRVVLAYALAACVGGIASYGSGIAPPFTLSDTTVVSQEATN
ncbi:hypothetical protein [Spongorhabdus nitratireducens]